MNYLLLVAREHPDIHAQEDYAFRWACQNESMDVVKFLIFDMNIEKTKTIEMFVGFKGNEHIASLFNFRGLQKNLEDKPVVSRKKI